VAAAHSPSDARVAVAIFDLDHFKAVNDTYGHAIGDAVLVEVSRRAKSLLRPADLIARIGGEEFALLLPDTAANDAQAVAERIRANIAEAPIDAAGTRLAISASFGVTTFAADSESFENALSRADAALYTAKQGGRNRVQAAEPPA